ncbi:hypothetical protein LTR95_014417 [Oleoguttula sp. CCFEE 5521]
MNPHNPSPFARGMQIHAVPEHERYTDSLTNTQLPWGYSSSHIPPADLLRSERHTTDKESGPFGRSIRRRGTSRSRSKTAEPRKEEDRLKAEVQRAEDEVFLRMRGGAGGEREEVAEKPAASQALAQGVVETEPTEVLLYGFSPASQYAALDFYETVSGGVVLEDYERHPPTSRPDLLRTKYRLAAQRSLSKASLGRKNRFAGGEHWVKITFDSLGAATLAVEKSPHKIKGCLVYAEFWRGAGPQRDEVIWASNAGAQITGDALPMTFSTTAPAVQVERGELDGETEETMSSGTVAGVAADDDTPRGIGQWPSTPNAGRFLASAQQSMALQPSASSTALQPQTPSATLAAPRLTRIAGATPAKLLPADMALMPKQPKQSWIAWLSGSEIIGATVPRTGDGKFDWERAGVYWRVAFWLDRVMGWDVCGLKGE